MAVINGTYIPLSGLQLMADPRNVKCYPGSGTAAINQMDNTALTLSGITYSGGYWVNAAAGTIISNASYNLTLGSGYTVIQWLNLTSTNPTGGSFGFTSGSNTANFYMGGATTMRWETYLTGGDLSSNQTFQANTWAMWAGTFSGTGSAGGSGTSSIYYNGNLDNTATKAGSASINSTFQIGIYSGPMTGSIGPSLFYSRALSATEIKTVFNAYRSSFGL